jgi:predicted DNA-binding transcriptional regulator YafY
MGQNTDRKDRDTIARRLAAMLGMLNEGKALNPVELATLFNVDLRTIQRDLRERLAFLGLKKTNGNYHQPSQNLGQLGHLSPSDLEGFAALAGVQGLFPNLSASFLRTLLTEHVQKTSPLLVKATSQEDITDHTQVFQQLERAVRDCHVVSFAYSKISELKTYTQLAPYKLIHHTGVWYVACADQGRMKAFTVSKIQNLQLSVATFTRDIEHERMLEEEDSIWLNANKTPVTLKIAPPAADYFLRRKLIGGQVIDQELKDGSLIVSGKVAHPNQILPIVRYWLPSIRILSPAGLQEDMERELRGYLSL